MSLMFLLFALLSGALGADDPEPPDEGAIQKAIEAARRGDRAALARLYRWHVARVYRAVRPSARNDADAEDLTQETFVKAFGALERYEPKPDARFVSWLLAIAHNTAVKRGRKLSRVSLLEPETLTGLLDAKTAENATELELGRMRQALLAALGELGDRERWVVCLRYGGELDAEEVSELTGLSSANVRKICERQRRRILSLLAERGIETGANA